jgi:hypothetical protein
MDIRSSFAVGVPGAFWNVFEVCASTLAVIGLMGSEKCYTYNTFGHFFMVEKKSENPLFQRIEKALYLFNELKTFFK